MNKKQLYCSNCKIDVNPDFAKRIFKDNTEHIEALCFLCGKHIRWMEKEDNEKTFFFGKYKGKKIKDVPKEYLSWVSKNDVFGKNFTKAILKELK